MKQVLAVVALVFVLATGLFYSIDRFSNDPYSYTDNDRYVATYAWDRYDNQDDMCDILWAYDRGYTKTELAKAYRNGKPDGEIWVNADISPTIPQVMALVDIQYDYCQRDR